MKKSINSVPIPRLYLGDMDGYTNEKIAEFIERDEVFTTQYATQDSKFTNAVEVTERQLVSALRSKQERNFVFNVYANYGNDTRLTPVTVGIRSDILTITQKLARDIRKRLIELKKLPKTHDTLYLSINPGNTGSLP